MAVKHNFFGADDVVWLVLMLLTVVSFSSTGIRATGFGIDNAAGLLILGIALFKVRLIARNFMEIRTAPAPLRRALDVWLLACLGGFGFFMI